MQFTFIMPLRQALDSLRIAQCAIETDKELYGKLDDIMCEIESIIEEKEAGL